MGDIKIKITEITIPNDFEIYYKAGNTPYPFDSGYTDYGPIFLGGTTTIDLIGDFAYGEEYWIMGKEVAHPERWMVKNITINDAIIYASFMATSPTPTPTISVSPTIYITPTRTRTPSVTPTKSIASTPSVTPILSPSITPTITKTPSRTPSRTPSITPSTSRNGMMVMITNLDAAYAIIGVSINGVPVTDANYPITGGMQSVGSTLELDVARDVVITLSNVSYGEHIEVSPGQYCTSTVYQDYITFGNIDTRNGVIIYYGAGLC